MALSGRMIRAMITALPSADAVAQYAMTLMITYLTGVWDLSLAHAAAIVNLYSGMAAIIPLGLQFIVHAFMGDYWMLLLSNFAYMAGCVLLTMSTPPVLAGVTGTCSAYEPECVGQVQKKLLYTALPLIAVGTAGTSISNARFCRVQTLEPRDWCKIIAYTAATSIPAIAAIISLDYISPWLVKFGIPAIFVVVGTLIFLSASFAYNRPDAPGVPEESVRMVCMVPLCLLFLMTGIVSAIGNTYFIEAASHMNGKIWGIKTTVLFFPFLFNLSRSNAKAIWHNCDPGVGVLVALVVAILCCITAAIVETFRLAVVKSHGLIDLPDATVPMSRFWLVPQYVFLGLADGLFELSIVRFYIAFVLQWPIDANLELVEQGQDDPKRQYVPLFAKAISGVGILFSVLSVHVVGEIKPAWFQHTLNTSRLQNYYWTLAALTSGNLVVTGLVFLACVLASNSSEDYQRLR